MPGSIGEKKRAALAGQLEVLQWLYTNHQADFDVYYVMPHAAQGGNLSVLEWLQSVRDPNESTPTDLPYSAVNSGKIPIVEWVWGKNYHLHARDPILFHRVLISGNLEMLKWLLTKGHEWNIRDHFYVVAKKGHKEMLEWMLEAVDKNEYPESVGSDVTNGAALGGQLELLKWATEERGFRLSADAAEHAAHSGM